MLNFTPCVEIFFAGQPLVKRLRQLAEIGFQQYEMWSWWDKDSDDIIQARRRHKIEAAACCTRFISLVDEKERQAYCDGLSETIKFCCNNGIKTIISQVGNEIPGIPRQIQHNSLVYGLREASRMLQGSDIKQVVEQLNTIVDHKGYYLSRSEEAAQVIKEVCSENVRMLFDIYHQQITEGNIIANLRHYAALVGHWHLADVPGRHEPGTGELNYENILKALAATGYKGNVGLEFFPSNPDHFTVLSSFFSAYAG